MKIVARTALSMALVCALAAPTTANIDGLAAVNRDKAGARTREQARPIFIRDRVIASERIKTTAADGGRNRFIDQISLNSSPGSNIVVDKHVYDPETQSGEIAVSAQQGALHLVGGRITREG